MAEWEMTLPEKRSSIEVSENAKGQFSYSVKLYYDKDNDKSEEVVDEIRNIYDMLKKKFR